VGVRKPLSANAHTLPVSLMPGPASRQSAGEAETPGWECGAQTTGARMRVRVGDNRAEFVAHPAVRSPPRRASSP
jgi:hypothetical protein